MIADHLQATYASENVFNMKKRYLRGRNIDVAKLQFESAIKYVSCLIRGVIWFGFDSQSSCDL